MLKMSKEIVNQLDQDIRHLEKILQIKQSEKEIIKLRIEKKKLILQKLEIEKIMQSLYQ